MICPQLLFYENQSGHIEVNTKGCISCGHCAAICAPNAIHHSAIPQARIHAFNRSDLPTPFQIELLIKTRRSNRAFTSNPIPKDWLQKIITAAHFAPTASNLQEIRIIAITNPQVLQNISTTTINNFVKATRILNYPLIRLFSKRLIPQKYKYVKVFERIENEYKNGYDHILRNAQALILFYTEKRNDFACHDANLAYQNASLMAEALGVAHFYTGFICRAAELDKKQKIQKMLNINGFIYAGMALGMPRFKFNRYIEKNDCNYISID